MTIKLNEGFNGFKIDNCGQTTTLGGMDNKKERPMNPAARTVEGLSQTAKMTDDEFYDRCCVNENGKIAPGMVAKNNGVYAAYDKDTKTVLVTKNPEVIKKLEANGYADNGRLGVPFSNGDRPASLQQQLKWEQVAHTSSFKAKEQENKRTAATARLKGMEGR